MDFKIARRFLAHQDLLAASKRLKTPRERLDAFQDPEIESSEGNTQDEYFGCAEAP
jgi:hypothetical protein